MSRERRSGGGRGRDGGDHEPPSLPKVGGTTLTAGLSRRAPTRADVTRALDEARNHVATGRRGLPELAVAVDPHAPRETRDIARARAAGNTVQNAIWRARDRVKVADDLAAEVAPDLLPDVAQVRQDITAFEAEARPLQARLPPTYTTAADYEGVVFAQDPAAIARLEAIEARERDDWHATLDVAATADEEVAPVPNGESARAQPDGAADAGNTRAPDATPPVADAEPLPHQAEMESSFGESLGHVEAHTGMAAELEPHGAQAMTRGNTMMFADKQPSAALVGHELTHVLQNQRAGTNVAMASGVASVESGAEVEARANAARIAEQPGTPLPAVRAAPAGGIHFAGMGEVRQAEAGITTPAGGPDLTPEASFLRRLSDENVFQIPKPVILERGTAGTLTIAAIAHEAMPADAAAVPVWCKILDGNGESVAEAGGTWHPLMVSVYLPITVPKSGDYRARLFLNSGRPSERILTRRIEVRTPDVDSARDLTDEELVAEQENIEEQLAAEADPARRETLLKGRGEMEWLAHERDLPRKPEPVMDEWEGLPSEPLAMRHYLEKRIATHGVEWTRQRVYDIAYNTYDEEYTLALEQLDIIQAEEEAFRKDFRATAKRTGLDLLAESEKEIATVLESYGLNADREILTNATNLVILGHTDLAVKLVMQMSKKDSRVGPDQAAAFEQKQGSRESLGAAASELKELQRVVGGLQEQYDELAGSNPPIPGGVDSASPEEMEGFARVEELGQRLAEWQTKLQVRWVELEGEHPVLAAFRSADGDPRDANLGRVAKDDDEDVMRGVLRSVLPKVKDIRLTDIDLFTGKLDPLKLPSIVEMTKQRMHIPPGSYRDGVADREVDAANGSDWTGWAIAAVTLGIAVRSASPTGGGSLVVAGAELAGLALDAYLVMEEVDKYDQAKRLTNTALDKARALSQEEPSLTWLAVQIVMLGVGAGFARQTFREAAGLHRAVRAGHATAEQIDHLDEIGEEAGLGRIGSKIANEAGADDAARIAARGARVTDEVGPLAASNTEALGRRIGARIEPDDALGTGVQVDFRVADDETVEILKIRVGRAASTADVLAHGKTIKLLQRYNGAWGKLRRILDEILAMFQGGVARPGSEAWLARMEAEKLLRIANTRRAALLSRGGDVSDALEAEVRFLEEQADAFDDIARTAQRDPVTGEHTVGMPDTSKIRERVASAEDATFEGLQRGDLGAESFADDARFAEGVTGGSPEQLRKNINDEMGLARGTEWPGYRAHHVIPSELKSEPVIQKIGFQFDHASNGIALPFPNDRARALSSHRGYHKAYNGAMKRKIAELDVNLGVEELRLQVLALQASARRLLESGTPLHRAGRQSVEQLEEMWYRMLSE